MTCREVADFIMDYLSGGLDELTRRNFEHHLSLCADCRHYLGNYRTTIALGRRAFENEDASASEAGVPEDLIEAILRSRK